MIPRERIQEQLSRAYLLAVAARAGCGTSVPDVDCGLDVCLHYYRRRGRRVLAFGGVLGVQLKATSKAVVGPGTLRVRVPHKTFLDMTVPSADPRVLVVLAMPEDEGTWLEARDDALLLRRCAYWTTPSDWHDPGEGRSLLVELPLAQRFDPDALVGPLRELAGRGL